MEVRPRSGPTLLVEALEHAGALCLRLEGTINEDSRLPERVHSVVGKRVLIHLGKVYRINSCGVRDWVRWIHGLEAKRNEVYFLDCSPAMVAQMNMVANFLGAEGRVLSLQAPYYCESCEEERQETFAAARFAEKVDVPEAICEICGELLSFDAIPQSYFQFIRGRPSPQLSPEVEAVAADFVAGKLTTNHGLSPGRFSPEGGSSTTGALASSTPIRELLDRTRK